MRLAASGDVGSDKVQPARARSLLACEIVLTLHPWPVLAPVSAPNRGPPWEPVAVRPTRRRVCKHRSVTGQVSSHTGWRG